VVLDGVLLLLHHPTVLRQVPSWVTAAFTSYFPGLPKPVELPLYVEIASVAIALLLAWHHVNELKGNERNAALPGGVEEILKDSRQLDKAGTKWDSPQRDALLDVIMAHFIKVLRASNWGEIIA
jgi:hypothetical protein